MSTFKTIVADPPWPMKWSTGRTRVNGRGERHVNHATATELSYKTMSIDDICNLNVQALAAPDCCLYLWCVDRFLIDGSAARVATSWGFEPKRILVWRKSGFGLGTFPRPQHECVLIAVRGRPQFAVRNVGSVQSWKLVYERRGRSRGRKHSAKPDDFFALVERASQGPFVELFARKTRPGWSSWGDEVESDITLSSNPNLLTLLTR